MNGVTYLATDGSKSKLHGRLNVDQGYHSHTREAAGGELPVPAVITVNTYGLDGHYYANSLENHNKNGRPRTRNPHRTMNHVQMFNALRGACNGAVLARTEPRDEDSLDDLKIALVRVQKIAGVLVERLEAHGGRHLRIVLDDRDITKINIATFSDQIDG